MPLPDPASPASPAGAAAGPMPERLRARLFLHGLLLFAVALAVGWVWLYVLGWPPVLAVHALIGLAIVGVVRHLRLPPSSPASTF